VGLIKLIFKNVMRHRLRSLLTVLGIAIAISAFGLLRTVIAAWYAGVEAAAPNRLVTRNAISLTFFLPLSHKEAIKAIPGVEEVSYATWFAGIYIDQKHSMYPQFAVEASPTWFEIMPEIVIPAEQKETFLRERNAVIVGAKLATRFGWKIGDTIRLRGTLFPGDWDFVIRGIYTGAQKTTDETWFIFQWQYLEERLRQLNLPLAGQVGWYSVKIADPELAGTVAQAIDERFKNSLAETLTETEKAFQQGFVSMSQAILVALQIVSMLIIGVILAILSNTMAMTARERLSEYAVIKTLGFGARHLTSLIAGESLLIALSGGILGMALIYPASTAFEKALGDLMGAIFPLFEVKTSTLLLSTGMILAVGLAAAAFPTWQAVRLPIAEGLRRIG
jgi:putative ABC transport system permease protein